MIALAGIEYNEVFGYIYGEYEIHGCQGYTVETWTVGGWREGRGGTWSSGDQQVYNRPGIDSCLQQCRKSP